MLGSYIRGRLFLAGITGATPLGAVLDVLTVIMMDTPGEQLTKWRQGLDRAAITEQARAGRLDRATWGLQPHQIKQQQRFMSTFGRIR